MPRTKTPAGFIENDRKRRHTFKKTSSKLVKKAKEMAALCDVPVAVVAVARPEDVGCEPTVWETEAGVIGRYRALPPDAPRAVLGHLRFLEAALAKEKAKLARLREAGPRSLEVPHRVLARMTAGQLLGMFASVDAKWAAARERRLAAIGLPLPADAAVAPSGDSGYGSDGGSLNMMLPGQAAVDIDLLDQLVFGQEDGGSSLFPHELHNGMSMHPSAAQLGGYEMPMMPGYAGPGACFQPQDDSAQPWSNDDFQIQSYDDDGTSSFWMQAPSDGYYNNGVVDDLAIASWDTSDNPAPPPPEGEYPGQFTGNNVPDPPAEFLNNRYDSLLFGNSRQL